MVITLVSAAGVEHGSAAGDGSASEHQLDKVFSDLEASAQSLAAAESTIPAKELGVAETATHSMSLASSQQPEDAKDFNVTVSATAEKVSKTNHLVLDASAAAAAATEPAWDLTVQVMCPVSERLTGEQLVMKEKRVLGVGGSATVIEVEVKRCGCNSLAAVKEPNAALTKLLGTSACSPVGASGTGSGSSNSSAEGGDVGSHAAAVSAVAGMGAGSCCSSCSVVMALKIPTPYGQLRPSYQSRITPQQYQRFLEEQDYTEYTVMKKCYQSDNISNCYGMGSVQYEGFTQPCLLLELSELGNAEQAYTVAGGVFTSLSDVAAQQIVLQTTTAVNDLHQLARTIHRDVKLSNLLLFGSLDNPTVKLCYFGIARRLIGEADYCYTTCGTPEWMAPEQSNKAVGQDYRVDSWPLGLVVLALRKATKPFWWVWFPGVTASERAAGRTAAALDDGDCYYNQDDINGTAPGPVEKAFVKRSLTQQISKRPPASQLLADDPCLDHRYVGG